MKSICEICNKKNLPTALYLGKHPLCDELIKIGSSKKNQTYKIEIIFCKKCVTAYQKYQIPKKKLFPKNYHYRSKFTKDVTKGMKNLLNESKKIKSGLKNKIILDVGCNDGSLLDLYKKNKSITVGIEPTNAANEAKSKGHDIFKNYIDRSTIQKIKKKYKKIDLITFTNVFAHIEDLRSLIKNLKLLISKYIVLIIENHYLGSIIKKRQFDTFYHEHPRTYSLTSFKNISKILNLNLTKASFPKRYGGNIRVIFSQKKGNFIKNNKIENLEKKYFIRLKKINFDIKIWKKNKKNLIKKLVKKFGPLPAKAFPGRAAILIKLLELNENHIRGIYEQSKSQKIGHYAPGTKIKILPDSKLKYLNKKIPIINLAWHINKEIRIYLKKINVKNKVIDILNQKDFINGKN